jgi:hypothetical protein
MIDNVEPPVSHDVAITTCYAKIVLTSHSASTALTSYPTKYILEIPHPNSSRVVRGMFDNHEHPTLLDQVTTTCHSKMVLPSPITSKTPALFPIINNLNISYPVFFPSVVVAMIKKVEPPTLHAEVTTTNYS